MITDGLITDGAGKENETELLGRVAEALEGGVRLVQLREKGLNRNRLLKLALKMRELTASYSAGLIINSDIEIALACKADGVHLPSSGFSVTAARKTLGANALIGLSTHSVEEAKKATTEGADFITFGPAYHTESKAQYGAPVGIEKLTEVAEQVGLPIFGLGGINRARVLEVLTAGARGVGLISAIMSSQDIRVAARGIVDELKGFNESTDGSTE